MPADPRCVCGCLKSDHFQGTGKCEGKYPSGYPCPCTHFRYGLGQEPTPEAEVFD